MLKTLVATSPSPHAECAGASVRGAATIGIREHLYTKNDEYS